MASAQGKTVIVTGGGGGLGKVIAETFLDAGANVVVCDINAKRNAAVEKQWTASYPSKFLVRQTDVSIEADVQKLVDDTVARFGGLDVLVNNAGIMDDYSPVGQCPKDMWDRVLAVNLNGPYLVSKAAVKQFEKQDTSVARLIINIGSDTSYRGLQTGAAYTASKAGLEALTKNMASYYGANRIYTVALLLGSMAGTNIADACAQGVYLQTYLRILAAQTMYTAGANGTPLKAVAKYCLFLSDEDITPSANGSCIVFNRNWPEA